MRIRGETVSTQEAKAILDEIAEDMAGAQERGAVADYIPELADVDPNQFGIAVALANGQMLCAGDAEVGFSIQSVSKVFTLALALGRLGDGLWERVNREPSGLPFNSILHLEHESGIPRNPFVNAGAIATTDAILAGYEPAELLGELLRFVRTAAGDEDIFIDEAVAASEMSHGHRAFSMAHFMAAHGNLVNSVERVCGTYFHHCAIEMSCLQLAKAGRFLMGEGPGTGLVSDDRVRAINALMMTCGHYDGSGDFAYRVGLPGKSGVGGGLLVIAPGRASIAVWSPGLNRFGNSLLGTKAVERLAQSAEWSVFW